MFVRPLLILAVLAGCHDAPPAAPPAAPPPKVDPAPPPNTPPPATTGPSYGETCGDKDACAAGLQCVSYYGIAGARGPQFKTCELRCADDSACPNGKKCNTIADGPGRVCR